MMKKTTVMGAMTVVMLLAHWAQAGDCELVNGSFEDDGEIVDITVQEPNGWDVNVPPDLFGGYVEAEWVTDANWNLTIYSEYYETFDVNDMATVSQEVYLMDVNEIIFDIKLDAYYNKPWDPNKLSAVVFIDGDVVWESNSVGSDVRGEYYGQSCDVNEIYNDENLHRLSFGLRVNVPEELTDYYKAHWDAIELRCYCGGLGFLPEDFDRDCKVELDDLEVLVEKWLDEVDPNNKRNLFGYDDIGPSGVVNFLDYTIYADSWDGNMPDLKMLAARWLDEVDPNDTYNLFHKDDDVDPNGVVNFFDFTIFAESWLKP